MTWCEASDLLRPCSDPALTCSDLSAPTYPSLREVGASEHLHLPDGRSGGGATGESVSKWGDTWLGADALTRGSLRRGAGSRGARSPIAVTPRKNSESRIRAKALWEKSA